jgi:pimeloyl-ACP methyl ester carboxylesterase
MMPKTNPEGWMEEARSHAPAVLGRGQPVAAAEGGAYHATITQPVLFVGGAEEAAVRFGSVESMRGALANLREVLLLPGCGHWVQQERPAEFNHALLAFLRHEVT